MSSTKKHRLTVSEEELKILEDAMGGWLILTRHSGSDFAPPPTPEERKELLTQGEYLLNRIRSVLSRTSS